MKIWMDGKLVDKARAKVSVFDHGVLYGDGVFEGIRAYGGRIFQVHAHIDRLIASAASIRLKMPYGKAALIKAIRATMKANKLADCYIRLVITRGEGTLGLNPFKCRRPCVFCIADQIELYPKAMYDNGMPAIIAKTLRTSATMLNPSIKSLNYLNNIMAKIECIDAGVSEAIMLNADGNVAEATGDNIFAVLGGRLVTPPVSAGFLIGITRSVVIRLAGKLGIPLDERDIKPDELLAADEVFMTGTAAEVIGVSRINGKAIGAGKVGPITRRLMEAFHEFTRSPEAEG
ncbi:MAG: branched-chain-amino-acid transaminase [Phycisphaerae bacterium]